MIEQSGGLPYKVDTWYAVPWSNAEVLIKFRADFVDYRQSYDIANGTCSPEID